MQQSIILLGYMGSGKSIVGKHLANSLSKPFIDLDNYIENKEKETISSIFKSRGELFFRKLERQYLETLLNQNKPTVVALGGGTPCYYDSMDLILKTNHFLSIYLKTSISELTQRLFSQKEKRPMISHMDTPEALTEFIGKHLFERAPFYERAELKIQTDGKTIEELVDKIIKGLT